MRKSTGRMYFHAEMELRKLLKKVFISLAADYEHAYFRLCPDFPKSVGHFRLINNNYKKYSFVMKNSREECSVRITSCFCRKCCQCQVTRKQCCFSLVVETNFSLKVYAFLNYHPLPYRTPGGYCGRIQINCFRYSYELSWEKARKVCINFKSSLPDFHSSEELQEFISIVVFAQDIPYLDRIFIGLKYQEQVSDDVFNWLSLISFRSTLICGLPFCPQDQ